MIVALQNPLGRNLVADRTPTVVRRRAKYDHVSMCADTFNTQSLRQASFLSNVFMIPFTDNTAVGNDHAHRFPILPEVLISFKIT